MVDKFEELRVGNSRDFWTKKLHAAVDGQELKDSQFCASSTQWIAHGSDGIPARDYIQHIRTHINALPSRVRTTRGRRTEHSSTECRACKAPFETTAHIIQQCERTHGGRIKRHDAIVRVLAGALRNKGYVVTEEPHLRTVVGLRKPDLLAVKEDCVKVVDVQVVSGAHSLNHSHHLKTAKYRDIPQISSDIACYLGSALQPVHRTVEFTSCTLSWRGVWSSDSADSLKKLGVSRATMHGITTRVLQGSHTNFVRWNQATSVIRPYSGSRPQHPDGAATQQPQQQRQHQQFPQLQRAQRLQAQSFPGRPPAAP